MRVMVSVLLIAGCRFTGSSSPEDGSIDPPIDAPADAAIDAQIDAPIDALPACPPPAANCTAFACAGSAHCYYACATQRNATDAAVRCTQDGMGCLVTINDGLENTCVVQNVVPPPAFPNLVWSGFVQTDTSVEPGGGWAWRCGTSTFVAPNWGSFEPNDEGGNEDCGAMNEGAAWIDGNCATQLRYVCEFPR